MSINAFQSYLLDGPCDDHYLKSKMKTATIDEIDRWFRGTSYPNINQIHEIAEITSVSPIEVYFAYMLAQNIVCIKGFMMETIRMFEINPTFSPILKSLYYDFKRNKRLLELDK